MNHGHKPTGSQKRQALITGLVLAAMAIGIYLVMILKFFTRP
jgi:hypothetical protein